MKFKYLGTGASEGWPAFFCQCDACKAAAIYGGKNVRTRAAALLGKLLIDFGPDLYMQKLRYNLDLGAVKNVLITHVHSDHFNVDNLHSYPKGFAHIDDRCPLHFYGSPESKEYFDKVTAGMISEYGADLTDFTALEPYKTVTIANVNVTPIPGVHGCSGTYGYLLEVDGRKLLYAHDTGIWQDERTWEYLRGKSIDVMSIDCTNGPLVSSYTGHMGFKQNIETRARMIESGAARPDTRFICNHFSHNGHLLHEDMVEEMEPHGFEISYDGMEFDL